MVTFGEAVRSNARAFAFVLLLNLVFSPQVRSQYCKWVDQTGCVHYAETCPEGVETEKLEIEADTCLAGTEPESADILSNGSFSGVSDEDLKKAEEKISFDPITSAHQLRGCWERIMPPADRNPNPNKIEIYPFEEPRWQYFCFEPGEKLYTYMTTKHPDLSPRALHKQATLLPSVERYTMARAGVVQIEHLDARTRLYWVTSVARVSGDEELLGLRSGDVLMTLRHAKTGEDLYWRHLRRID